MLILAFVILSSAAHALGPSQDLGLEERENLAFSSQWLKFMQYESAPLWKLGQSGYKSRVVNDEFFASPEGRTQPLIELNANIELFRKTMPSHREHPQCVYPARYAFLSQHFQLAPPVNCVEIENWFAEYQPQKVSYVYASQYIANPMSVFGHSFFLFGSKQFPEYLWAAYNYAADIPDDTGALSYAYKGIFGGFRGLFDVMSFQDRIQIYTNLENRDLWIYDIDLTPKEIDFLVRYLWELSSQAHFDYYFFFENCAGILLSTLEVVRPGFEGLKQFSIYIPPGDISKPLMSAGMVTRYHRMPALNKILHKKIAELNPSQQSQFFRSTKNLQLAPDVKTDRAVIEALMDYIDVLFAQQKGVLTEPQIALRDQLYATRAQLGGPPTATSTTISSPPTLDDAQPPHLSHGTRKIALRGLWQNNQNSFEFLHRPALHGFIDSQEGYLNHSHIEVLSSTFNFEEDRGLILENVTFMSVKNIQPMSYTELPKSWQFSMQFHRNQMLFDEEKYMGIIDGGFGFSGQLPSLKLTYYAMAAANGRVGELGPLSPLTVGPLIGQIGEWSNWRWHLRAGYNYPLLQAERNQEFYFGNEVRFKLARSWTLNFEQLMRQLHSSHDSHNRLDQYSLALSYFYY